MTELAPSQIALRLCAALLLAASVLTIFRATVPLEMLGMRPPFYQPQGPAYTLYVGASLGISLLTLLAAALLPQAALPPKPSRIARALGLAATGAVALIALANIGLASLPLGETDPTTAYWRQVAVQSLGALLTILPGLALAGAFALRLAPGPGKSLGLAALALLIPLDLAASAGLSPLPTAGLLLALILTLALALHRQARLPAPAQLWLIGFGTLWALPWAIGHLPRAGAALMLSDPSRRGTALAEALLGDPPAAHLALLPMAMLGLCALAALLYRQPARQARAVAALLTLTGLAQALAPALDLPALAPEAALSQLHSGTRGAGPVAAMLLAWVGGWAAPVATALAAAWLWLRGATRAA